MRYVGRLLGVLLGVALFAGLALGGAPVQAQDPDPIRHDEVLRVDMTGWEGHEAHMWVTFISQRAETGAHTLPTPRFVYVVRGAVTLEVEGQPPQMFHAGHGFQVPPGVGHHVRNASPSDAADILEFQIVGKGQPLQD